MRQIQARLRISDEEKRRGAPSEQTVAYGCQLFDRFGFLVVEEVLDRELVGRLQDAYSREYASLSKEMLDKTCLRVGDQRYMITIEIKPPFNTPLLYANPFLFPILKRLLSPQLVLNSFGSVCAFPGSRDQRVHLDHPWLFESSQLSGAVPSYAITMVIPLVDIDLTVGTTAIWEGSHRGGHLKSGQLDPAEAAFPTPRIGDVYMMDYRLVHGGTANNSERARPIMYVVYSRPWFRDSTNFSKQPPIAIAPDELAKLADSDKALFRYHDLR